jgi:hypothetical protein
MLRIWDYLRITQGVNFIDSWKSGGLLLAGVNETQLPSFAFTTILALPTQRIDLLEQPKIEDCNALNPCFKTISAKRTGEREGLDKTLLHSYFSLMLTQ